MSVIFKLTLLRSDVNERASKNWHVSMYPVSTKPVFNRLMLPHLNYCCLELPYYAVSTYIANF